MTTGTHTQKPQATKKPAVAKKTTAKVAMEVVQEGLDQALRELTQLRSKNLSLEHELRVSRTANETLILQYDALRRECDALTEELGKLRKDHKELERFHATDAEVWAEKEELFIRQIRLLEKIITNGLARQEVIKS